MNFINSKSELRRWYSDQISNIDIDCYKLNFSDLVEVGTDNFLTWIRDYYDFKWGDKISDDVTVDDIFECIANYGDE